MRNDFGHVLATGGHHKSERMKRRGILRGTNNCEPMRAEYGWREGESPHVTPLIRFLDRSVGRRWGDLYSEVCRKFDRRSSRGKLVHDWLHRQMYLKSYLDEGGDLWICTSIGPRRPWEGKLYVDPWGILRKVPGRRQPYRRDITPDMLPIDKKHEFRKIEGIWYWFEFQVISPVPYQQRNILEVMDSFAGRPLKAKVWIRKRQLSKKELRTLKISNS